MDIDCDVTNLIKMVFVTSVVYLIMITSLRFLMRFINDTKQKPTLKFAAANEKSL